MSIDTTAPRTRRAVIAGAFGALLGSIGLAAKPSVVRAGTDGDVVLDATNTAAGTTVINGNGSNPVFRVANADQDAVQAISANGVGLLGGSGDTSFPDPIAPSTGVYGISVDGHGVYGASDSNAGVYAATNATDIAAIVGEGATYGIGVDGDAEAGIGVRGHGTIGVLGNGFIAAPVPEVLQGTGVHGHGGVGVYGTTQTGSGVMGRSGSVDVPFGNEVDRAITGVYGFCGHDANATGVAGETTVGVGTHGIATSGVGVRGQTTSGIAVKADTTSGTAVKADTSSGTAIDANSVTGNGIRGSAGLDGVIGESKGNKTGIVGFSGSTQAPAGPANTGVYGEASQDATARGVFGKSTTGQGVRGEATSGAGVRAEATTGLALDVAGRAAFSRSGRASLPAGAKFVDVTVPGGLSASANVLATLQIKRAKVHVLAARPNQPSSGKVRIYVSDVASITEATPIAWFVLG
jgi:hypothetical protein